MNDNDIAKLAAMTKAFWPQFEAGPETVPAWRLLLEDVDYEQAKAALLDVSTSGAHFPPPPGVIRKAALKGTGAGAPDVDAALDEVMTMIRRRGYLCPPVETDWSHPAVGFTVRALGGWREVCESTNPEAFRAHFRQLYTSAVERSERVAMRPPAASLALERAAGTLAAATAIGGSSDSTTEAGRAMMTRSEVSDDERKRPESHPA